MATVVREGRGQKRVATDKPVPAQVQTVSAVVNIQRQIGEQMHARRVRAEWMELMGFTAEEIAESLRDDPPTSLAEETMDLDAARQLRKNTPPGKVLSGWAINR